MAASPAHVFAMKARAARTRDIDDLRLLADIIGVDSADVALRICTEFSLPSMTVAGIPLAEAPSAAGRGTDVTLAIGAYSMYRLFSQMNTTGSCQRPR
jgi:hypothetical protein